MTNRLTVLLAAAFLLAVGVTNSQQAPQPTGSTVTPDDYKRWRTELRNWGRWGPNDQKGTANLITPQKVQNAARLVRSGIVVSLAGPVPQQEAADVGPNQVFRRTTNSIGPNSTTDTYQVSYHGLSLAHTDAFCHFF